MARWVEKARRKVLPVQVSRCISADRTIFIVNKFRDVREFHALCVNFSRLEWF
jgi:hypothetical protein